MKFCGRKENILFFKYFSLLTVICMQMRVWRVGSRGTGGQGDECLSPDKGVYIPLLSEMQSMRGRKGGLYRKWDNRQ